MRGQQLPVKKNGFPTLGQAFKDCVLELVRPAETGVPTLCLLDGKKVTVALHIQIGNRTFVQAKLDPSIASLLRLPRKMAKCESARSLIAQISSLVTRYAGLDEQGARLISFFALASWLVEALPCVPQLRIVGPNSTGAMQLLRLLACFCRHPLVLAEVDIGGICALPMGLSPTLLVRQSCLKRKVSQFLNSASLGGMYAPRHGRLVDLHVPVAVFCDSVEEAPEKAAVIEIPIVPTSQQLPVLDVRVQDEIALEFQDKLCSYRVNNLHKADACEFDAPQLAFPMPQIAKSVAACVPDDADLQLEMVGFFADEDARNRLERSLSVEAVVLDALLFFVHDAEHREAVHVGEIAKVVNEIRMRRGATQLDPRKIGHVLRSLDFRTQDIDSAGRGVLLVGKVRQAAHRLAWAWGAPSVRNGVEHCEICKEFMGTPKTDTDMNTRC